MNDNSLWIEAKDGRLQRKLNENISTYSVHCMGSSHIKTSKTMPPDDIIK